ncbi:MAG: heme-binding protein [Rhodospirillaceae bacterium]|nr:heme-binding protein [Rhodospirillaceae bacterium]
MVSLKQAQQIVEIALKTGHEKKMRPLTVAVLDARGCLVAYAMEDGGLLRENIAKGKAWGALGMGRSSRALEQFAKDRPHFITAAIEASGGRLVPVPGGVLVKDKAGALIGAVGVSGDTSDNDEIAAVAGIEAAGLVAGID